LPGFFFKNAFAFMKEKSRSQRLAVITLISSTAISLMSLTLQPPGLAQANSLQLSGTGSELEATAARKFEEGNYNEAIASWTTMIGKGFNPNEAMLNRAKAYIVIKQPLLAIADLENLEKSAKRTEKSTLLVLKAVANNDLGNKKESLRLFKEAEATDQNPYVYINRASLYQEMGDLAGARKDIEKAIAFQPTRANYFNLAVLERRTGNYTECINILTSILKQDSSFVPAYTQRGICLASAGKHQEAIKDLLKAIAIDPSIADAYFQMGKSMLAIGNSEGAKPYLLKSADIYLSQGKTQSYQAAMALIAASTK
jgi:tetratricopeptide (TPR) repeat protein